MPVHIGSTVSRSLLAALEVWLWSGDLVPAARVATVAEWVVELSDLYTVERGVLARRQGDREHLGAKLLYFLASDAPKVGLVLDECARRDPSFATARTIVDVGCGVGATSVGYLDWCAKRGQRGPFSLTGIDHSAAVLAIWTRVVAKAAELAGIDVTLSTVCADAFQVPLPPTCDLVLCQTAFNERLARDGEYDAESFEVLLRWSRGVPVAVIEPALKTTTRALQRLRDRLLVAGGMHVVGPCPHDRPCPMLARPDDWCHESRRIEPTPMVAAVQAITRRRDDRALYSFLALVPGNRANSPEAHTWRLVSDALGSRGKTERWTCRGNGELHLIRVLDRERSECNALLVEAPRGEVVFVVPMPASDRIGPQVGAQLSRTVERAG